MDFSTVTSVPYPEMTSYEIGVLIGEGAYSQVFRALDKASGTAVAIKFLTVSVNRDESFRKRFAQECLALKEVDHPNIVKYIDHKISVESSFLVMEWIDGDTLDKWFTTLKVPFFEPRVFALAQLAKGIGALHFLGKVHRDLKCHNILVDGNGTVKIIDLGLIHSQSSELLLTQEQSVIGTLPYMSPEQINGENVSMSSDLYSFGIIACEVLTGRHPFAGKSSEQVLKLKATGQFEHSISANPTVPSEIRTLIGKCISREIEDRPSSIWECERVLMEWLMKATLHGKVTALVTGDCDNEAIQFSWRAVHSALVSQCEDVNSEISLTALNQLQSWFPDEKKISVFFERYQSQNQMSSTERPKEKIVRPILILISISVVILFYLAAKHIYPLSSQISSQKIASEPFLKRPVIEKQHHDPESKTGTEAVEVVKTSPTLNQGEVKVEDDSQKASSKVFSKKVPVKPRRSIVSQKPEFKKGTLAIFADKDARVFVDGRRYSRREVENLKLNIGKYNLIIEKEGFEPIERTVEVKHSQTTKIFARVRGDK